MTGPVLRATRRGVLAGAGAAAIAACALRPRRDDAPFFEAIEARLSGRVGVYAERAGADRIAWRADARFAMCSTFKWALVAMILARVQRGEETLDAFISYGPGDIAPYSPATEPALAAGGLTLEALLAAAVRISDNTAANLLLRRVGGPEGFTSELRLLGDDVTRLDRWEVALNENRPGDLRDTTTPRAMALLLGTLAFGDYLDAGNRGRLQGWMREATTGLNRLRGGLPASWDAGDKTGTSGNGAFNDVAFALPPDGGAPILIACYVNAQGASGDDAAAAHRDIAARIAARLVGEA